MRHVVVVLGLVLALGLPLAGCLDAQEEPDPEAEGQDGAQNGNGGSDPEVPRGSIRGLVTDAAFNPLEGAGAELLVQGELIEEQETEANGSYVFKGLEPGEYRVKFSASCCKDKMRGAIVEAGRVASINVNLEPKRPNTPYVEELEWEGFIGCSLTVPGQGVLFNPEGACAETDENNDPIQEFVLQPGLATVVVAMEWEQVTTNALDDMQIVMTRGPYAHSNIGNRFFTLDGASPLQAVVGPEGAEGGENLYFDQIDEPWDVRFTVTASESGNFVYQQPFTVYYDLYYWDPAPDGVSALPE